MIAITKRPIAIYQGQESRWNAAYNPIVYTFEITDITDPVKYNVIVEVYEFGSDTLLGVQKLKPFLKLQPDGKYDGIESVDVSSIVNSYLKKEFVFDYSKLNQKDQGSSLRFYIKYKERIYSNVTGNYSDSSNYIYVIPAARELGNQFGSNLADYVPFGVDVAIKAKFLTKFKETTYYPGYPFFMSFIYSEGLAGVEVTKHEEELDVNRQVVATYQETLDPSQIRAINSLKLRDNYNPSTKYVRLANTNTGDPISDTYVDSGYVDTGYTE